MHTLVDRVKASSSWFTALANKAQSPLLLLVRLYWGW